MGKLVKKEFGKDNKNLSASFTIEAAYIMPIIVLVIVALIYFVIYLYNITLFESRMTEATLTIEEFKAMGVDPYSKKISYDYLLSQDITHVFSGLNDNSTNYLEEYISKNNQEDYVLAHVENIRIKDSMMRTTLTADLVLDVRLPLIFDVFNKRTNQSSVIKFVDNISREEKQRIYTVLKDTVMQVKGVKGILEKVKNTIDKLK